VQPIHPPERGEGRGGKKRGGEKRQDSSGPRQARVVCSERLKEAEQARESDGARGAARLGPLRRQAEEGGAGDGVQSDPQRSSAGRSVGPGGREAESPRSAFGHPRLCRADGAVPKRRRARGFPRRRPRGPQCFRERVGLEGTGTKGRARNAAAPGPSKGIAARTEQGRVASGAALHARAREGPRILSLRRWRAAAFRRASQCRPDAFGDP